MDTDEIVFTAGLLNGAEPCVLRRGVYLDTATAERLLPLLAAWSPTLSRQLEDALNAVCLPYAEAA